MCRKRMLSGRAKLGMFEGIVVPTLLYECKACEEEGGYVGNA